MKPGHGEIVLAEGDVEVPEQERELIEAFRRELDAGMWAAVPTETRGGRREAELVKSFAEVPRDAERVIFFPRAAGGAPRRERASRRCALALGTARDRARRCCCGSWLAPALQQRCASRGLRRAGARGARAARARAGYDPGRERRAEQRARALLRSCVDERGLGDVPRPRLPARVGRRRRSDERAGGRAATPT